jgi:hypothetical protein
MMQRSDLEYLFSDAIRELGVQSKAASPEQVIETARKLRQITAGHPLSNEDFNRIKGIKRL